LELLRQAPPVSNLLVYATLDFSPDRKLRSHEAGHAAEQPGEDGNLGTIVRGRAQSERRRLGMFPIIHQRER
jgi:hypothetical protein